MNRIALGVVVLGLAVAGTIVMTVDGGDRNLGGVLVRASVVLGAVWLVLPNARRVRREVWTGAAVFAVVLIAAPRLILWGFLIAMAGSLLGFLIPSRSKRQRP